MKRLDERTVIMKKIEQKRHQIGEMIIKGCYVKELQKEVSDFQKILNEAEQIDTLEKYPENIGYCKKM